MLVIVGSYGRFADLVSSFHYYPRLGCSCLLSGGPRESLTLLVLSAPRRLSRTCPSLLSFIFLALWWLFRLVLLFLTDLTLR